jgi:molybdate transport system regulatory protein
VKYLSSAQLETLASAFRTWLQASRDERSRQSRTRLWLLFLLLRHTGMRLGEALELDDRSDIDLARGVVKIGGDSPREVPLPDEVVDALKIFFEAPMSLELRGQVFHMDQGYVRRIFSERGKGTGIPRELLNPRVLRHSRAVELLRGGVPVVVVDAMLGHQGPSCQYVSFSDADTRRIMTHYIYEEKKMKTSARNMFVGQISAIRDGNILSEVEVTTATGLQVVSVITKESFENLGLAMGMTVIATVKAPWVVLVKEDSMLRTSARNKFCGRISAVNTGQIAAEVVVDLADGTKITSLITDESVNKLDLKVGDEICAMVKAFSVILALE